MRRRHGRAASAGGEASGETGGEASGEAGGEAGGEGGGHVSARQQRKTEEELRIVFNGQRHCYAVRNAWVTEPAWVARVRHAWREIGVEALPPMARIAAARLLER